MDKAGRKTADAAKAKQTAPIKARDSLRRNLQNRFALDLIRASDLLTLARMRADSTDDSILQTLLVEIETHVRRVDDGLVKLDVAEARHG